jgi:hypothetical protein
MEAADRGEPRSGIKKIRCANGSTTALPVARVLGGGSPQATGHRDGLRLVEWPTAWYQYMKEWGSTCIINPARSCSPLGSLGEAC